jgi:hypothetical protein
MIPYSDWVDENTTWLAGFRLTRIVTEPEGVKKAVDELIPQAGTWGIWYDDEAGLIRYRVNRPVDIDESVLTLDESDNIVRTDTVDEPERLINEVYCVYDQRDPTKKMDDASNYRQGLTVIRQPSQSAREQGRRAIKTIYARWNPAGNRGELEAICDRILSNRAGVPVRIDFTVEVKDDSVKTSEFVDLTSMALIDAFGNERQNVRFRVIRAKQNGATMSISAREELFSPEFGRWSPDDLGFLDWEDAGPQDRRKYLFWANDDGNLINSDSSATLGKAWL